MGRAGSRDTSTFERVYSVIVAAKGLYGLLELFAGAVVLLVPGFAGQMLTAAALELAEGSVTIRYSAAHVLASASAGVATGAVPLALFLVIHGVVKLLTAYALLRRAIRWYPWALGALGTLLIVQAVDLAIAPTVGAWVLAVLDVVVIALVAWEYRHLRHERSPDAASGDRVAPDGSGADASRPAAPTQRRPGAAA